MKKAITTSKLHKFAAMLIATSLTASVFTGCDKNNSDEPDYIDNPAILVEQIELNVSDSYEVTYTNNSDYTIIGMQVWYVPREDITDAEKEALKTSLKNNHEVSDEDLEDLRIFGVQNSDLVEPGATSFASKLSYYHGKAKDKIDSADFALTEAGIYTIDYIDGDEIVTLVGGGYGDKKYYIHEIIPKYNWGEDELTKILPKPDAKIITTDLNSEAWVIYTVYNASEEMFYSYVGACKENGFTGKVIDHSFSAQNGDEFNLSVSYEDNMMSISLMSVYSSLNTNN